MSEMPVVRVRVAGKIVVGIVALTGLLATSAACVAEARQVRFGKTVRCRHGAVVCVSPQAAAAGIQVLVEGGTAVDGAIATAFALAVTWPSAGNIGGGGYMLIVPAEINAAPVAVDFRETAPAAATQEMFVKPEGRTPHRRVGVPGTVRGLALAHQRFGRLPWKRLVAPAVALARDGFALDAATAESLNSVLKRSGSQEYAELHRIYGRPGGASRRWRAGDRMTQPDLAATLERIAERGPDGFYTGETAALIAAEMRSGGGFVTERDLSAYTARFREPVRTTYRGCEVLAAPPSSSGGIVLAEMLNILESFDLRSSGRWSPETLHLMIEAMKRAYRDRACYLGDPDVVVIPDKLTRKDYARQLAAAIDRRHDTPSTELAGDIPLSLTRVQREPNHTTHLSVIQGGAAVSMTFTLESAYGSRVVVRGGGFILNDEMNDFGWLPGITDATGRIGTPPNLVAPGKRMLSSMTPTIVRRGGKPLLVTGSPGGRTIINTVLGMVVNIVDFDLDPRAAVDAPRLHHQWLPDQVKLETLLVREHPEAVAQLRRMGHRIVEESEQGDAHSIWIDAKTGDLVGVADKREDGSAAGY